MRLRARRARVETTKMCVVRVVDAGAGKRLSGDGCATEEHGEQFYRVTREASPERAERVRVLQRRFVHRTKLRAAWRRKSVGTFARHRSCDCGRSAACINLSELPDAARAGSRGGERSAYSACLAR